MATARDIITRSLRLIGVLGAGETGESQDAIDALSVLNGILESWPLSRLMILAGQEVVAPLTAAYSYNVGPSQAIDTPRLSSVLDGSFIRYQGIDTPLIQISMQEYASIPVKYTAGRPSYIAYEPNAAGGSLTFYPTPQVGMELHLAATLPFTQFDDLDTPYSLPPGYARALQYWLAVEIAPEYGKEASPTTARMAINSTRQIRKANGGVPVMDMPSGIPGVHGGGGLGGGYFSYQAPPIPGPTPDPDPQPEAALDFDGAALLIDGLGLEFSTAGGSVLVGSYPMLIDSQSLAIS